jgi:endonuclease/exonuclease/phosphatase family metal-dependent hydrolase
MRRVLLILVILIALLAGLILWMAGGLQSPRTFDVPPIVAGAAPPDLTATNTGTITVVVWNIAWGYGWGSEGTGKAKPPEYFTESVKKIGGQIAALGADIALIQEIDFDATRSGRLDQAKLIAERAKLPFIALAPSWEANWVPFPYWPPSEHFGHMASGGAILSRFPIEKNTVRLLEKPAEYPFYYRLFYLFRYLQHAELRIGKERVHVFNTHLEAFKEKNRVEQAQVVERVIAKLGDPAVMFGGDFNAVPSEATKKSAYPDETTVQTSHEKDTTVAIIRGVVGLSDAFPQHKYIASERDYLTFPAHEPNRKLDHFFYGGSFELIDARVAREVGDTSDHLPLVIRLRFRPGRET